MNKFINKPDSLANLFGCVFWLCVLAGFTTLLFWILG
jgi:hypothetical protein